MPGTNVDPYTVAGSSEALINEAYARWYNIREHKSDLLLADMVQWPQCTAQSFDQNTGNPAAPPTAAAPASSPSQVEPSSSIGGTSDVQTSGTGNVAIQTGQTVQFANKGPFNGKWIIQRARFELNDGSLKTTVQFRKCLKPSDYPTLTSAGAVLTD